MDIEFENISKINKDTVELIRTWRNKRQVSQYMYTDHYITKEEHQRWVKNLRTGSTSKAWVIKYNKKPVGLVSLSNVDYKNKVTEWGFYIADESVRGKGIGSATLYKLIEYVFEKMNFNKMSTMVLESNPLAIKLYEKFGFKKEGALRKQLFRGGKYIDVIMMGFLKEDWEKYNIKPELQEKLDITGEHWIGMGHDLMSMNACLMVGKQAGIIGILTTLSKKIDISAIVAYDENVSMISKAFNVPIFKSIHDKGFIEYLRKSDLLISVHGKEIVPKDLLSLPKMGCINVHPCLYKYKGKNPIQQLLEDKNTKASVGVHYMTEKIDRGEVIIEEFVDLKSLDSVQGVYNVLYPLYTLVLSKALDIIEKK